MQDPAPTGGDAVLDQHASSQRRAWVSLIVLSVLTALFAVQLIVSLTWTTQHDAPIMLYIAFLIDKCHYVPYRDILDFNLPGTYWFNLLIARVFGYSDLGFRLADLLCFTAIAAISVVWLRQFGRRVTWAAVVVLGLIYVHFAPDGIMQREYIALIPISAALATCATAPHRRPFVSYLIVGLLFGLTALIKPHLPIGLPVVILFLLHPSYSISRVVFAAALSLVGLAIPIIGAALYLWHIGAWSSFVEMVTHYWPLYAQMSGDLMVRSGTERAMHTILTFTRIRGQGLLLVPAALGTYVCLRRGGLAEPQRRFIVLLLGLAVAYSVYALAAGKFWAYHWFPCFYIVAALGALCVAVRREVVPVGERRTLAIVLGVCAVAAAFPSGVFVRRVVGDPQSEYRTRTQAIATFLTAHMRDGDTVQPLDWTGGALKAMLMARARIATRFLYDFYFYHHLSDPYIKRLRERFIASMEAARPRFVIQIKARPWPHGENTTTRFPELERLLKRDYQVAVSVRDYTIFERRR